jgi:hypothetical protein
MLLDGITERTLPEMMYEILIFIGPEVLGDCIIEQPHNNSRLERPSTFLCTQANRLRWNDCEMKLSGRDSADIQRLMDD